VTNPQGSDPEACSSKQALLFCGNLLFGSDVIHIEMKIAIPYLWENTYRVLHLVIRKFRRNDVHFADA